MGTCTESCDRRCFESLDKTLQDLTGNNSSPFGGKSVLLGGDFRQTLPVKPKCTKAEIIESCHPRSYLWKYLSVFKLSENMRLGSGSSTSAQRQRLEVFATWLLGIGDGEEGVPIDQRQRDVMQICIPADYLLPDEGDSLQRLIQFIYHDDVLNNPTPALLAERAIITPKNDVVNEINNKGLLAQPGECTTYLSTDSMIPHSKNAADTEAMYPVEYLNVLNFSGIPEHRLGN